jgi:quercetin dioxygenase-like cupin family protein
LSNLIDCGADPCFKSVATGNLAIYQMVFKNAGSHNEGHAHTFHHFTLVASGSVKVESNGRESIYQAGQMVWIPKSVAHRMTALEPFTIVYCIHAMHKREDVGDVLDDAEIPGGTPDWLKVVPLLEADAKKLKLEELL